MALPLVPMNKTKEAFEEIVRTSPQCMQSLINYFRGYWMTKVKIDLWHVSDLDVRTNNVVEGNCSHLISHNCKKLLRLEPSI